ncbi:hypothetical protein QY890_06900 [Latilactobacillus sakei]
MIKSSKLVNLVLVSSTVLGMVVTAGTSTAMAATKTSADTSSVMTKKDNSPRIDYQTSGTLADKRYSDGRFRINRRQSSNTWDASHEI